MTQAVSELFGRLWSDYLAHTPSAKPIHQLLGKGADIVNDHIALRTFNLAPVTVDALAEHFKAIGYVEAGQYAFEAKKLKAKHFEHPDPTAPKVFISELLVEEMPEEVQTIIKKLVAQVDPKAVSAADFLIGNRPWQLSLADYQTLAKHSEYASWTAAWGYRANHFTVSVNHLAGFDTLEAVNQALKDAGHVLNSSGGEIKGSPEVLLEQSSTMADKGVVKFSDGELTIPSCFYEFALRYPQADGELYSGFVAASADKIFESTAQN
ncbi:DUF1338 domain-containing protein [Paraferrimonas sedimenticola]|uniref:2-oxoadipate dioxygenase/decarboxylase n=1 Tax=Paraferrimonas sedimenticola TaxID=375674 RepID=A0AA37RUW6_9GAMM|nr:DUF1338 domain-containing protein [Paraferrimonas sedimenticola]GLP95790.1 DUF1338 domain-containing protein [Paraferrimonas sedimenticola]